MRILGDPSPSSYGAIPRHIPRVLSYHRDYHFYSWKWNAHWVQDVPHCQRDDQAKQEGQADEVDIPLSPRVDGAPAEPLRDQKRRPAAVERGQRKKIEQSDDDAEERRDIEKRLRTRMRRLTQNIHRGHRPAQLIQQAPRPEQAAQSRQVSNDVAARGQDPPA